MSQTRRTYTAEFKRQAIELARTSGKTRAAIERELGLSKGLLKQWTRKAEADGEQAFPGHGRLKAPDEELRQLRRELIIVTQERDILKKAVAVFAHPAKRNIDS